MPVLHPAELWRRTGRYDIDELFKLKDRKGADMVLAMTHEEVVTFHVAAGRALLPRPAADPLPLPDQGARRAAPARRRAAHARVHHEGRLHLRPRPEGLDAAYEQARASAYDRIFDRCGLEWYRVESDVGMMGGIGAHEYMAPCAGGRERRRARPPATRPTSRSRAPTPQPVRAAAERLDAPEPVDTPGADDDRGRSRGRSASPAGALLKAFPVIVDGRGLVLVRRARRPPRQRDQAPQRARRAVPARAARTRSPSDRPAGLHRPGRRRRADPARRRASRRGALRRRRQRARRAPARRRARPRLRVRARRRAHRRGGRHRRRRDDPDRAGDRGRQHLQARHPLLRAARRAPTSTSTAQEQLVWMGSYGIGPARIAAAAVEQFADEQGISWPRAIAPFDVELVGARQARDAGARAGRAPLRGAPGRRPRRRSTTTATPARARSSPTPSCSGVPLRLTVGKRSLDAGEVEVQIRRGRDDPTAAPARGRRARRPRELWREPPVDRDPPGAAETVTAALTFRRLSASTAPGRRRRDARRRAAEPVDDPERDRLRAPRADPGASSCSASSSDDGHRRAARRSSSR